MFIYSKITQSTVNVALSDFLYFEPVKTNTVPTVIGGHNAKEYLFKNAKIIWE